MSTNATQKTTLDDVTRAEQGQTAQELFHDAIYFGTDGTGADHWWSIYHQAIVAFEANGNVLPIEFPELKELSDWIEPIDEERGWDELRYTEDAGEQLVEAVEA